MATIAALITGARQLLHDPDADRWSDADLLTYANEAIKEIRTLRPDLFLGTYSQATPTYIATDSSPVSGMMEAAITDYITYRAFARDDEFAETGKAVAFLARYRQQVLQL